MSTDMNIIICRISTSVISSVLPSEANAIDRVANYSFTVTKDKFVGADNFLAGGVSSSIL